MSIRGIDKRGAIEGGSQQALHTVQKGDTLKSIAKLYAITSDAILKLNPHIKDQAKLQEGLAIHIPGVFKRSHTHTQKLLTKDVFEHSRKSYKLPGEALAQKPFGDALAMKHPGEALAQKPFGQAQAMKHPGEALAQKPMPGDALAQKPAGNLKSFDAGKLKK